MRTFLANKQGQNLAGHCVLVGRLSEAILTDCYAQTAAQDPYSRAASQVPMLRMVALVAGLLHDAGKLDPNFQAYLDKIRGTATAGEPVPEVEDPLTDGEQITAEPDYAFSFNTYPRHEEVSWLLLKRFFRKQILQRDVLGGDPPNAPNTSSRYGAMEYAIYWHHAKPLRDGPNQEDRFADAEKIREQMRAQSDWIDQEAYTDLQEFLAQVDALAGTKLALGLVEHADDAMSEAVNVPPFKANYSAARALTADTLPNVLSSELMRTAVRSALVSADRIVSHLSAAELEEHLTNGTLPVWRSTPANLDRVYEQITEMQAAFDERYPGERSATQTAAAAQLAAISNRSGIACLRGPAGSGKTKVALQYLNTLKERKRIYIFVPRTAIGEGLFHELTHEYGLTMDIEFLSGATKLFYSGQEQTVLSTPEARQGTGCVVITTIDQICQTMLSHQRIDLVSTLADSHVIFDEFHELFEIPGIVLLFLELMQLRHLSATGTLLLSATPNPQLLQLLGIGDRSVVRLSTFNEQPFTLNLVAWPARAYTSGRTADDHPLCAGQIQPAPGAIVVCNTATVAQLTSIRLAPQVPVLCYHSKYTPKDKAELLDQILLTFGKAATAPETILISGPIVQASLNISTGDMHTEMSHAENILQRVGRQNRFGQLPSSTLTIYFSPGQRTATRVGALANARVLSAVYQRHRTEAFSRYIEAQVGYAQGVSSIQLTLPELYSWYEAFHQESYAQDAYREDFQAILTASADIFRNNSFDPVQYPAFSVKPTPGEVLASRSLRNRSYFILPLAVDIAERQSLPTLALLWDGKSSPEHLLSDELRYTSFSTQVQAKYLKWSREANKPSIISPVLAGAEGAIFLKALAQRARRYSLWSHYKNQARRRTSPILVCRERFDSDNLYYLRYADLRIGLIRGKELDAMGVRSG